MNDKVVDYLQIHADYYAEPDPNPTIREDRRYFKYVSFKGTDEPGGDKFFQKIAVLRSFYFALIGKMETLIDAKIVPTKLEVIYDSEVVGEYEWTAQYMVVDELTPNLFEQYKEDICSIDYSLKQYFEKVIFVENVDTKYVCFQHKGIPSGVNKQATYDAIENFIKENKLERDIKPRHHIYINDPKEVVLEDWNVQIRVHII